MSPYKGTRTHVKSHYWAAIRGYIQHNYPTEIADGLEADDLLGCALRNNSDSVICTRDKDMDTISGWHYRWRCGELQPARRYYVSPFDGWYFYYYQMLVGDIADNIKGVIGIGDVKARKILRDCSNKDELHAAVKQVYIDVYGAGANEPIYYEDIDKNRYWRTPLEIMSEMADLLYIGVDRTYLRRFDNGEI